MLVVMSTNALACRCTIPQASDERKYHHAEHVLLVSFTDMTLRQTSEANGEAPGQFVEARFVIDELLKGSNPPDKVMSPLGWSCGINLSFNHAWLLFLNSERVSKRNAIPVHNSPNQASPGSELLYKTRKLAGK
jgi:hypothetical protein